MNYKIYIVILLLLTGCYSQEYTATIQDTELNYTDLGPAFIRGCMAGMAKVYLLHKTAIPMTVKAMYGYCEEMRRKILCDERGICPQLDRQLRYQPI